jgi:ParB family chromosome partitioning protein
LVKKPKNRPADKKQVVKKDRFLNDLEKAISAKLQAKVQISGSDKKGLIEIRYTSMDELNRLSGLILDDLQ